MGGSKEDHSNLAPPPALARELDEVAAAALAFGEAIRVANELPPEFPKAPVLMIAAALAELPKGTGEGAYEPLIYARNRLTALRREFILTEAATREGSAEGEGPPPLTRGLAIDLTLTRVVADVSTALDAHRAWASREEEGREDVAGAVKIDPTAPDVAEVAARARETQKALEAGVDELRAIIEPGSVAGERLIRQTQDAAGVVGLGHAELEMKKVVPRWLRRLGAAIGDARNLMRKSARAIQMGVDIARPLERRWTEFQNTCTGAIFDGLEGASRDITALADKWEGERAQARKPPQAATPDEAFTIGKARAMILRGEAPPAAWVPMIDELDFRGNHALPDLRALSGLTALTTLDLSRTQVTDVGALAGLTALTTLDLSVTKVTDVGALAGLTALTKLDLSVTKVTDVGALAGLTALTKLDLSLTQVKDVSALAGLTALTTLDLSRTKVKDVGALAGLTALTTLTLSHTKVTDVGALAGLTALTTLDLSGTQVKDVGALAGLTALTTLDLGSTKVKDVGALTGLTALTTLDLRGTQVDDVSALAGLTALTTLDLNFTQVNDVGALAALPNLAEISVESDDRRDKLAASLGARGAIVQDPEWMRR